MAQPIELLDPKATPRVVSRRLAIRRGDFAGRPIGFLSNKKANADLFLTQLQQLLRDRLGPFEGVWAAKPAPMPASDETLRALSECAAVVTAVAD